MSQIPPQQSRGFEHTSPVCVQNDEPRAQVPFWQSLEQQSPLAAQALPEVRHVPLSGSHFPPVHFPPQHAPSLVHAPLSAVQVVDAHTPLLHARVQQSVLAEHAPPAGAHLPIDDAQACVVGSQSAEQHWLSAAQD
jgi:hypothetical protein